MPISSLSNVSSVEQTKIGQHIDLSFPLNKRGVWEFTCFCYNRSTTNPIDLEFWLYRLGGRGFLVRRVAGFTAKNFFFSLELPLPSDVYGRVLTSGAIDPAENHSVLVIIR